MRSTGEVLGLAETNGEAFFKAEEAAGNLLPMEGTVLISVNQNDKPEAAEIARAFTDAGFSIDSTGRTYELITEAGIPAEKVKKLYEGRPNILDLATNGKLQIIVNSPAEKNEVHDDSYLRKAAVKNKIAYVTTMAAARAAAEGIKAVKEKEEKEPLSLQEWHKKIQ